MLRQRQPRKADAGYLKWLRAQRCACGCFEAPPCDAAHLRASSAKYGKANAIGQKPDDRWALPLKHGHHMRQHAYGDEIGWWAAHGIHDPFALALKYYRQYKRGRS